jgi:hypothetical protein
MDRSFRELGGMEAMQNGEVCFICILAALMIIVLPAICQTDQNVTSKTHVLRLGLENAKPINSLDVAAIKSMNGIGSPSIAKPFFNLSQRTARAGRFNYNTSIYKPIYNASGYSIRPFYEIPSFLKQKPVYDISGYPSIKAPNSIP